MAASKASSVCSSGAAFRALPAAPRSVPFRSGAGRGAPPRVSAAAPQQRQQRQQRPARVVARASKDDETIERMKQDAEGSDIWGSEVFATLFKVAVVAVAVGVVVLLLDAAQPIVETTIERFPTPQ
ncbi:hypothetical protein Rsub_05383 [Raphidocelis subcapitata]|uniref:Uncharacterized protein n=1 Tax=Raphidocelis subcapitata TaxID=307507 RepID=A0A2V0P374_9CHLO|nr:hypothetical protein Rsub_05383 [Raphidocelis subcapitata]|eukprot:GBF92300.1 hypothetical protein Rsub_05383 [Raphidocelis subcapitata]